MNAPQHEASGTIERSLVSDEIHPHPLADLLPRRSEAELLDLADDIAKNGLIQEIVRYQGQILDGRRRHRACQMVGVEPRFWDYMGDDPVGVLTSCNVSRHKLSQRQGAMAAAKAVNFVLGSNKFSQGLPIGRAAKLFGVSERAVARCRQVLRDGVSELINAVEFEKLSLSKADELSRLSENQQRQCLSDLMAGPNTRRLHTEKHLVPREESGEIPPAFEPILLDSEDQKTLDDLKADWNATPALQVAWLKLSPCAREEFFSWLRGIGMANVGLSAG